MHLELASPRCVANSKCMSFALCTETKICYLKAKKLKGGEPEHDVGDGCYTVRKVSGGGGGNDISANEKKEKAKETAKEKQEKAGDKEKEEKEKARKKKTVEKEKADKKGVAGDKEKEEKEKASKKKREEKEKAGDKEKEEKEKTKTEVKEKADKKGREKKEKADVKNKEKKEKAGEKEKDEKEKANKKKREEKKKAVDKEKEEKEKASKKKREEKEKADKKNKEKKEKADEKNCKICKYEKVTITNKGAYRMDFSLRDPSREEDVRVSRRRRRAPYNEKVLMRSGGFNNPNHDTINLFTHKIVWPAEVSVEVHAYAGRHRVIGKLKYAKNGKTLNYKCWGTTLSIYCWSSRQCDGRATSTKLRKQCDKYGVCEVGNATSRVEIRRRASFLEKRGEDANSTDTNSTGIPSYNGTSE